MSILFGNYLVGLEDKPSERSKSVSNFGGPVMDDSSLNREHLSTESREPALKMKNNADRFRLNTSKGMAYSPAKNPGKEITKSFDNLAGDSETKAQKDASSLRNLGKAVKGRETDRPEAASDLILDATNDLTLPTEVNQLVLSVHALLMYF